VKKFISTSALAGLSFLSISTPAAEPEPEIIVTATRTAQTSDETLASVTVITREDIERSQAQSIGDLLRGEPGLSVVNGGGTGKPTSIFLRGTESGHVLVLMDGIRVGSATLGTTAFEHIPLAQVDRIEVVRGPRSSVYGSEAIGGVIQIFTRKGGGPISPNFSVTGGSYRTYEGTAGAAGGGQNGWFSVNASGYRTDGFNACNGILNVTGCFTDEPDDDGYRNGSGSVRGGYRFDNGAELDAFWTYTKGRSDFDQADAYDPVTYLGVENGPNETVIVQEVIGATIKLQPVPMWRLTLLAGQNQDQSDNFKSGGIFDSSFNTRRGTASVQNDFSFGTDHVFTIGADYQDDHVDSTTLYTVDSRDNTGVFAQHQAQLGAHDIQLSLRRDNNEQFGYHDTGGLAYGYQVGDGLRLIASYGTAFKAPTFNELYYPVYGNPDLKPTTSRAAEIGARGSAGKARWSLALFESKVENLIVYDSTTSAAVNADPLLRGVEATLATPAAGWETHTALTVLDPENRSGDTFDGNDLPRRARESFRFDADRGVGPVRLGGTLRGEGRRYDDLANTVELKRYATLDLRGEYQVARDWTLQARIENLLDKDYETAAHYNQPGRSVYFTVRYRLQHLKSARPEGKTP